MKLADYLSRNEISQVEFAKQLGVTRAAVNVWAKKNLPPKHCYMRAVIAATGGQVKRADFGKRKKS